MCKAMEDMRNQAAQEGAQIERYKNAKRMLALGKLSVEEIADCSGLSIVEVEQLKAGKSA